ncbi:MAG: ZIP family metal transporter [Candidatus Aenigmatarchaeota archaeon]
MKKIIPILLVILVFTIGSASAHLDHVEPEEHSSNELEIITAQDHEHEGHNHIPNFDMTSEIGADIWIFTILAVIIVSLISLVGVAALSMKTQKLKSILIYLVSFSAGALLGDAFIHLLPEIVGEFGFTIQISIYLLGGIILFFVVEKLVHWRHCHLPNEKDHVHPFAYMNLMGDAVHNFIDGLIIAASFIVSFPVGIATTIAVILHEIPQEIGDFGVLIHGGFSKKKAICLNFLTALTAIIGAIVALIIGSFIENIALFLVPIAAGGFIYIAGSDLIPELHKEVKASRSFLQLVALIMGIIVMMLLLGLE